MKLRFKLRTLLIATALICVFLGLQVHVHRKAKRFVEEMDKNATRDFSRGSDVLFATLSPLSFSDVIRFERRGRVNFETIDRGNKPKRYAFKPFHIGLVGEAVEGKAIYY